MTDLNDIPEPDLDELLEEEEIDEEDIFADLLDGIEQEDDYESEPFESLDRLRDEEYESDGSYYRSLGIGWDEVDD